MKKEKLIAEYQQKIVDSEREIERYTKIKKSIKEKYIECPTKYEADFDYGQMVKDISICNAQRQAYVQFIKNLEDL